MRPVDDIVVPENGCYGGKLDECSGAIARSWRPRGDSCGARLGGGGARDALAAPAPPGPRRPARPRRPPPPGLAGRLGRPCPAPPAARLLPGQRVLAVEEQPGVLGRARGLRAVRGD